jgi:hypothetical protein
MEMKKLYKNKYGEEPNNEIFNQDLSWW